jgi:hypothetical protein
MLRILTRPMRRRIGRLVALAYLVCVIAPPVSLAFTDGAIAAHCLSEDHHTLAAVHVHAIAVDPARPHDHAMHDHAMAGHAGHDRAMPAMDRNASDPSDTPKQDHKIVGGCCGLFCIATSAADLNVAIGIAPRGSILQPALEPSTVGHEPDRIDRPPITLASL